MHRHRAIMPCIPHSSLFGQGNCRTNIMVPKLHVLICERDSRAIACMLSGRVEHIQLLSWVEREIPAGHISEAQQMYVSWCWNNITWLIWEREIERGCKIQVPSIASLSLSLTRFWIVVVEPVCPLLLMTITHPIHGVRVPTQYINWLSKHKTIIIPGQEISSNGG